MRLLRSFLIVLLALAQLVWAKPKDVYEERPHVVKSIETGAAALEIRLQMVERARASIEVEYFIFHNSDSTRIFVEALVRKKLANPEVKIRLLVDYFALSKSIDAFDAHALIERGIEVRYYNPVFLLNIPKVSHRNHRKIIVVDQKEALLGGRNMGDEYFDLRPRYNFLDRDIWVEGPIAAEVTESFDSFWESVNTRVPAKPRPPSRNPHDRSPGIYLAQKRNFERKLLAAQRFASPFVEGEIEDDRLIALRRRFHELGGRLLAEEPAFTVSGIQFIADGPDWKIEEHRMTGRLFYTFMDQASKQVDIEVPYFYLQKEERAFFTGLRERGVNVRLLINAKNASNEYVINYITLIQGLEFSRMGFEVFLNEGRLVDFDELPVAVPSPKARWMVHAKTMSVDESIVWIGTLNMDPRSVQRLNAELGVVVFDEAFTKHVKRNMQLRMAGSLAVENGLVERNGQKVDPAEADNLWELIQSLKTLPFYVFENQI
mgnify:CR=1 FL=1